MMRNKLFLVVFFALLLSGAGLQAAQQPPLTKTAPLQVRYPDAQKLKSLQADESFRYSPERPSGKSFWDRFWWWLRVTLGKLFYDQQSGNYGRYALYVLGVGIMGWGMLKLLGVEAGSLFGRQPATLAIAYETYQENIHGIDFPVLIAQAEAQGDYRRAIRLYYLAILKKLTDLALIEWKPGKTNRSYVAEIENSHLRRSFEALTRQFEFIWYGGSTLQKPVFQQVRLAFEQFENLMKTEA
jgi:hypothetical protein